jgi:hypothetical protein
VQFENVEFITQPTGSGQPPKAGARRFAPLPARNRPLAPGVSGLSAGEPR